MNELSIEEKAKAYDGVRDKITLRFGINVAKEIFSQFEESEDERIRKWLIHYFKEVCDNVSEKEKKGVIDWLEKQGEQKPADNSKSNLLTLERAKKMSPFMRSGFENEPTAWSEEDENYKDALIGLINEIKSQPLKRLEDWDSYLNWIKSLKDRIQPERKWSAEDSRILYNVKAYIGYAAGQRGVRDELFKEANEWLNSLPIGFIYNKNYNEDMVTLLIGELKQIASDNNAPEQYQVEINWLKSLRPQNTWKPSDEYNILDVKDVADITYYCIEDEPNHIDYVLSNNCEIVSEQNPIDKVESKFHEGDWIISNNAGNPPLHITNITDKHYIFSERDSRIKIEDCDNSYHLWSLKDAKDGDVLRIRNLTFIFQEITNNNTSHKNAAIAYCSYEDDDDSFGVSGPDCITDLELITPATKEQRDILFTKMKEAGYEWDAENKELKRIYEEVNGEDYGIDGLYAAIDILQRTLGEVDGYQSDDGILEHKAAITIIRKLYEQKFVWDEDDARNLNSILSCIKHCQDEDIEAQYNGNRNVDPKRYESLKHWLKFLKNRIQSQNFTVTDTELIKAKKDAYNDALNKIEYHSDTPTFDDGWSAAIDYIKKKYVK